MTDTIFALSSGALPAGIAVIRVSGSRAERAAERLCGILPPPRRIALRSLVDDRDGSLVDRALVVRFEAPATATGEPLVEFQCHGGRAVVAKLFECLAHMPGLREAQPGEFTRRALMNGRLDLTEAEGLAELLNAETEWQRRAAVERAEGGLRREIEEWRDRLLVLAARAEAAIDYVDEDETELEISDLVAGCAALSKEWKKRLDEPRSELLQSGLRVVIAGPPNAGKSSLFNALIGTDKAIVTPIAGTTRDLIEARMDLNGIPLTLIDTAGLRETDDAVERIGVERARQARERADIIVWLGRVDQRPAHDAVIVVQAKFDARIGEPTSGDAIDTSVVTGEGLNLVRDAISAVASNLLPPLDHAALNRRQANALGLAVDSLAMVRPDDVLLTAEAIRQALQNIDRLTGRQNTEDVLDALFQRFCLGK